MPYGNHKSTTLNLKVYEWLEGYKEAKGLRSIAQAIEFVIREAGYNVSNRIGKIEIVAE